MSEGAIGLTVLLITALASALVWHAAWARPLEASLAAAICAALVFQVLAYLHMGYLDPFFLIAFLLSLVPCGAISFSVGGLAQLWRKRAQ